MYKKTIYFLTIVVILFIISLSPFLNSAQAKFPDDFGGTTEELFDCDLSNAEIAWINQNNQGTTQYFYLWGSSAIKPFGPPTQVGQKVLGKAFPEPMICYFECGGDVCERPGGYLVSPNAGSIRP